MNRMMLLLLALSASFAGVNASTGDPASVEASGSDQTPLEGALPDMREAKSQRVTSGESLDDAAKSSPTDVDPISEASAATVTTGNEGGVSGDAEVLPVVVESKKKKTVALTRETEGADRFSRGLSRWFRAKKARRAHPLSKTKEDRDNALAAYAELQKEGVTAATSQALKYKRGKGKDGKDIVLNALPSELTPEEIAVQDAARGFTVTDGDEVSFDTGPEKAKKSNTVRVGKLTKATDRSKVRTMPTAEELVAGKAALKSLSAAAPAVAKPTVSQRIKGHWNTSEDGSFNKRHAVATGIDTVAGLGLGATIVWKKSIVNALFTRGLVSPTSRLGKLLLTPGFVEAMSVGLLIAIMETTGLMTGAKGPRGPVTGLVRMVKNRNNNRTAAPAA